MSKAADLAQFLTAATGAATYPSGTTAERPSLGVTDRGQRYNTDLNAWEGWNGTTWGPLVQIPGQFKGENGTVGTSPGDIFRVNEQVLNSNVTIGATENASAAGPLTIADGVTLTVESGGNLSIV